MIMPNYIVDIEKINQFDCSLRTKQLMVKTFIDKALNDYINRDPYQYINKVKPYIIKNEIIEEYFTDNEQLCK